MDLNKEEIKIFIKELKEILKESTDTHRRIVIQRIIYKFEQVIKEWK